MLLIKRSVNYDNSTLNQVTPGTEFYQLCLLKHTYSPYNWKLRNHQAKYFINNFRGNRL